MGFFNPFYYLKYLLRKLPKKVLVFICIFLIICLCHLKGYCADDVIVDNVPNADIVDLYQKLIDHNFYVFTYKSIEYAKRNNNTFDGNFKTFCRLSTTQNVVFGIYTPNYYNLYFEKNGTYLNDNDYWLCLCWSNYDNYIGDDRVVIPGTSNSNYSSSRELSCSVFSNAVISHFSTGAVNPSFYGGSGYNVTLIDAFKSYIPSDLFDILYSIGNDTYSFTNDNQVLQEISQKIDETNEQLEEMNEFFNSDTTPTITNSDLPTDTMTDVTSSGFDGIFTKIYNAFTAQGFETINITIPYLNYTFSVSSDFTRLAIRHFTSNIGTYSFENFFYLLWYFAFSRYIVLDIYKYINDIKNGNISKTDTNIKADML